MRPSFVLARVDLIPLRNPPRGNWKETWQECLEVVRRCVYLDKDLVLPPMAAQGPGESFYVVASTDLKQGGIMTTRIREQLDRVEDLSKKASVAISLVPIEFVGAKADISLEVKVQALAARISDMILDDMHARPGQEQAAKQGPK